MRKSLADWASIAEIFGAVAIVISLVFVGIQVGANTRATQAATAQQTLGYEIELLIAVSEAAVPVATTYFDYTTGDDLWTGNPETEGGWTLSVAAWRLWEDSYFQWKSGALSDEAWASRAQIVTAFSRGRAAAELLEIGFFNEDFSNYLQDLREGV